MSWNSLKINDKLYIFRIDRNFQKLAEQDQESQLTIWLSDFRVIYKEYLTLGELLHRAKTENPIVEFEQGIVLDTIFNNNSPHHQLICEDDTNSVFQLKCKYYISQLPFHFYWRLAVQSADVFFEEITRALFSSLLDAQAQRTHLLDVIQSKDLEIEQYKIDGAELIRKHLGTKPFARNTFEQFVQSSGVSSLLQIAKNQSKTLGITHLWSASDSCTSNTESQPKIEGHPLKRASSTSPNKPAKRTKEVLARSKIQSGPDASVKYGEDSEEPETNIVSSESEPKTESAKPSPPPKPTNLRKIKTKLNL